MLTGNIEFCDDDLIYLDHFPGNPTVPGTLIISAFCKILQKEGYQPVSITNFRFRKFVKPGLWSFRVELINQKAKVCLLKNQEQYCTGHIKIGESK